MIGFIIGLLIGLIPGFYLLYKNGRKQEDDTTDFRRGIYNLSFDVTRGSWQGNVDIQYEIRELESAGDISKIEVVSLVANQSKFNTKEEKEIFTRQINHSWIESSKIRWVDTKSSERNKKINQILNA
jgi:hypothetical protein